MNSTICKRVTLNNFFDDAMEWLQVIYQTIGISRVFHKQALHDAPGLPSGRLPEAPVPFAVGEAQSKESSHDKK
jgi:hypothetical protein